jgi:hypothetical protein
VSVFGVYRERVAAGCEAGLTLDQMDEQLIRDAPLDEDEKAALWLFGYATLDMSGQTEQMAFTPSAN